MVVTADTKQSSLSQLSRVVWPDQTVTSYSSFNGCHLQFRLPSYLKSSLKGEKNRWESNFCQLINKALRGIYGCQPTEAVKLKKKNLPSNQLCSKNSFIYGNSRKINWLENNYRQNDDLGEWEKHF